MEHTNKNRPDPVLIGGRMRYTLTSYGPVSVVVETRKVSEEAVDSALRFAVSRMGGGPGRLFDNEWIHDKFPKARNANDVRDMLRKQLVKASAEWTEQQKREKCANALVARLVERVPKNYVASMREIVKQTFDETLKREHMTREQYLLRANLTPHELEDKYDDEAVQIAEREAALEAWADKRHVVMTNDEIQRYMPMAQDEFQRIMSQLEMSNRVEMIRAAARRMKALSMVVAECNCTYRRIADIQNTVEEDGTHMKLV